MRRIETANATEHHSVCLHAYASFHKSVWRSARKVLNIVLDGSEQSVEPFGPVGQGCIWVASENVCPC
jgi:hypothetical protein